MQALKVAGGKLLPQLPCTQPTQACRNPRFLWRIGERRRGTRPCAQGVGDGEYQPTSGVRVQKVEHTFRSAKVKVELWDCAGGADTKK